LWNLPAKASLSLDEDAFVLFAPHPPFPRPLRARRSDPTVRHRLPFAYGLSAGGYPYPDHIANRDSNLYFYPVKDRQSMRDSFYDSYMYLFFKGMDEPNMSLKPTSTPTYRFVYEGYANPNDYIITLSEKEIVVKKLSKVDSDRQIIYPDTNRLTPQERFFVKILDEDFPINKPNPHHLRHRRKLDSVDRLYPQLLDPSYYNSLMEKEGLLTYRHFQYTLKKIPITPETYKSLVKTIDTSGYWQFPPKLPPENHIIDVFDAAGFILEANSSQKYNMVEGCFCGDDSTNRFELILHALAKAAALISEIHVGDTTRYGTTLKERVVIQDVHLEDVKEQPPLHKPHHPKKRKGK
jgi:hypothetical protein